MKKTLRWFNINFEPIFMAITFYAICLIITVQVILRFFFEAGFSWAEEVVTFIFVWSVFLAVPYVTKNNKHINVGVIRDLLPTTVRKIIMILTDIAIIGVAVVLFIGAFEVVESTSMFNERANTVDISMNWKFAAPAVGYAIMILRGLQTLIWKIMKFNRSFDLFANPGGCYTGIEEICFVANETEKADLIRMQKPETLDELKQIQNKKNNGKVNGGKA